MSATFDAILDGVELLSLDAGNVIIFLDHARLAELVRPHGFSMRADQLIRAEGVAKLDMEHGRMVDVPWSHVDVPGAAGWGRNVATMLNRAGVPEARLPYLLDSLWQTHVEHNLWCRVPAGFAPAMGALRRRGVRIVVVSNSEGVLRKLFTKLGILSCFDLLLDSGEIGVEKPDPRIFEMALEPFRVQPANALHLGDTFATDVVGARAAGMRTALIDPFAQYEGKHLDVPRVPGAVEVALALAQR